MEIRPLYLISYFIAAAYLLAWLARFILGFIQWSRKAGLGRLLVGQRIFLNPLRSILPWNSIFLVVSGGIFGWSVISWVEAWFVHEWLLLILPGLAILSHELLLTRRDIDLLAVMALIAGLHDQRELGRMFSKGSPGSSMGCRLGKCKRLPVKPCSAGAVV